MENTNTTEQKELYCGMSREQLDRELQKGIDSMKTGKTYTVDEIDALLKKEFDI